MKTISIQVEDMLYAAARKVAAAEGTSVENMVHDYLVKRASSFSTKDARKKAAARMVELSRQSNAELPIGWKFDRESAYSGRLMGDSE